jgi:ATP-binding cassette subfamily B protein
MQKTETTVPAQSVVRFYLEHVRAYPRHALGVLLSVPFTVLINSFLPTLILASVLTRLAQGHYEAHDILGSFGWALFGYAGLLMLGHYAWRLVDHLVWQLELRIQQDLAEEVFQKLLNQTADFHANNFSGSLVSKNSKLLGGYIRIADTTIFQAYPMVLSIVFAVSIMAFKAPLFAVLLLVFSVLFLWFALLISRPVRKASGTYAAAESTQTGYLADALANSMAIKSFASGMYERTRFNEATNNTRNALEKFSTVHKQQMNVLGTSSRFISGMSLAIAVICVMTFSVDIGVVFLILSYTGSIVEALFQFGNSSLRNYSRAIGDSKDMVDTLALTPSILDPAKPQKVRIRDGLVEFDHVTFTHDGSDDALFNDFSVSIQPGQKIGLVGHSGSGKTTFTRLLLRFSDIDAGKICIDGQSISAITQDDLRRNIAYVPQEPLLFHRTIRENIAYGAHEASDKLVEQAAKRAHAHEFIVNLPQGYDTLVGERGVKLSGGQRQRIAIARAMIKNAPVLVLDEATSALDSESEALIQDALWKLMEGRTAIVIAHRLSTIQHMDRIVVLDNGRVVEDGSHQQLLKQNGPYAKLWARQSGGFIED